MDETEIKHVLEAALLAAGRPLPLDKLVELFAVRGDGLERATVKNALDSLAADYQGRGIEIREVASGYRVQVKRTMTDWLQPLWEERAPRYTRALLETLALVAYRQPITRAEIEEVRGVVVSTNIVRTLLERSWIRVVGHRDVPGKPAMFGTTREFLDYFGLKKLEELPALADLKDGLPELSPQTDLVDALTAEQAGSDGAATLAELPSPPAVAEIGPSVESDDAGDDSELAGPNLVTGDEEAVTAHDEGSEDAPEAHSAEIIPLRASGQAGAGE